MGASDDGERQAALHAFGHLLKRLRTADDLTQEELAERAGRLFGAAAVLRETFGASQQANDRALIERSIAREHTGEPAFANAWNEGGRMSLEAALMHALGEDSQQGALRAGPPSDTVARARTR